MTLLLALQRKARLSCGGVTEIDFTCRMCFNVGFGRWLWDGKREAAFLCRACLKTQVSEAATVESLMALLDLGILERRGG